MSSATPPSRRFSIRSLRQALIRARRALLELVLPRLHYYLRRRFWNRSWAREDFYSPTLLWFLPSGIVPPALIAVLASGWLDQGGTLLDIGCGDGGIAAYLAKAGYDVLGVDFAEASIARARSREGESDRLRFQVLDMCEKIPDGAPFDILFDRGCFHDLPKGLRPAFLRTLVACSRPGTRMILMLRVTEQVDLETEERSRATARVRAEVHEFFSPYFTIERADVTYFNNRGDENEANSIVGLAVRMSRH